MDDYEIVAETEGEALHLLAELQNELLKFELHLNPSKTGVYPLPVALEQRWTAPLNQHALNPTDKAFKTQVIQFFDTAFDLSLQFPNEAVLKYAIGRIANLTLKAEHALVEDLLLQSARIQPGTLVLVLRIILANPKPFSRKKKRADLLCGRHVCAGVHQSLRELFRQSEVMSPGLWGSRWFGHLGTFATAHLIDCLRWGSGGNASRMLCHKAPKEPYVYKLIDKIC